MNIYRDIFVDFWVMKISSTRFTVIFLNKKLKSLKSHFSYIILLTHLSPAQPRKKCKKCQKKPCNLTTLWANYYLFSFNCVFHPTKLAGDYYYYYLWVSCSGSKASKASWLYTLYSLGGGWKSPLYWGSVRPPIQYKKAAGYWLVQPPFSP